MARPFFMLLALASAAAAQAPFHGFLFNWDRPTVGGHFDAVTRFDVAAERNFNRIDVDDYVDWGKNPAGNVVLRGFAAWMIDANYATPETFAFVGHAEDPANPGFPLLAPSFTVPNIPLPPGPAGTSFLIFGTLNVPVTIAGGGDVFVGVGLPAMVSPVAPFDGLFIGHITRTDPALQIFDEPGPRGQNGAGVFANDYNCAITGGIAQYVPIAFSSLSQLALDVAIDNGGIGGVALAETNQTSLVPSNAPLGTSDFLSGLHPDVNGFNPGRADNIGFGVTHHTGQMPAGSPVLVLLAFGGSPLGSQPITNFPGFDPLTSAGRLCIDFTAATSFLILTQPGFLPNMAEGQLMLPLSPQVRQVIAQQGSPFDFWWQGFAIDLSAPGPDLEVRTSGCVIQHLN
jgi:hypothetical protein